MAVDQEQKDILRSIDAVTTRIGTSVQNISDGTTNAAARVQALVDKLAAAPTPEEVAQFKLDTTGELTKLTAIADAADPLVVALNGIAADGTPVVPPPPPDVPAASK